MDLAMLAHVAFHIDLVIIKPKNAKEIEGEYDRGY